MGLDLFEFVMAVEGTFGIEIPDRDAEKLETPRLLIEYLVARMPASESPGTTCLTQRAFYRLRAPAVRRFDVPRGALRTDTPLAPLIRNGKTDWMAWRSDVSATNWPALKRQGVLTKHLRGVETMGELARHLAKYDVAALRDSPAGWTRTEIEAVVISLVETELAIDMSKHTLDSKFHSDMGVE